MKHMYDCDITEEDFDFMKISQKSNLQQESLLIDYIALFGCLVLMNFLYQHIQIDIHSSFDNFFDPYGIIFKHKLY